MENAPVIYMVFNSFAPGTDVELKERYTQWTDEAYIPMSMKRPGNTGIDRYQNLQESPEYPQQGSFGHYKNLKERETAFSNPDSVAIRKDHDAWNKRGVREPVWLRAYELVKGFRNGQGVQGETIDTKIEDASIMHLEGFRLLPEEQEKYTRWLGSFGYSFIPLFMKLAGFKGYDFFRDTGHWSGSEVREREYPSNLSVLYFENLKSFEDYTKSQELVIFQKALRSVFPLGFNYKWYVQYKLVRSWRK